MNIQLLQETIEASKLTQDQKDKFQKAFEDSVLAALSLFFKGIPKTSLAVLGYETEKMNDKNKDQFLANILNREDQFKTLATFIVKARNISKGDFSGEVSKDVDSIMQEYKKDCHDEMAEFASFASLVAIAHDAVAEATSLTTRDDSISKILDIQDTFDESGFKDPIAHLINYSLVTLVKVLIIVDRTVDGATYSSGERAPDITKGNMHSELSDFLEHTLKAHMNDYYSIASDLTNLILEDVFKDEYVQVQGALDYTKN